MTPAEFGRTRSAPIPPPKNVSAFVRSFLPQHAGASWRGQHHILPPPAPRPPRNAFISKTPGPFSGVVEIRPRSQSSCSSFSHSSKRLNGIIGGGGCIRIGAGVGNDNNHGGGCDIVAPPPIPIPIPIPKTVTERSYASVPDRSLPILVDNPVDGIILRQSALFPHCPNVAPPVVSFPYCCRGRTLGHFGPSSPSPPPPRRLHQDRLVSVDEECLLHDADEYRFLWTEHHLPPLPPPQPEEFFSGILSTTTTDNVDLLRRGRRRKMSASAGEPMKKNTISPAVTNTTTTATNTTTVSPGEWNQMTRYQSHVSSYCFAGIEQEEWEKAIVWTDSPPLSDVSSEDEDEDDKEEKDAEAENNTIEKHRYRKRRRHRNNWGRDRDTEAAAAAGSDEEEKKRSFNADEEEANVWNRAIPPGPNHGVASAPRFLPTTPPLCPSLKFMIVPCLPAPVFCGLLYKV